MCFTLRTEISFHAKVDRYCLALKPTPSSLDKIRRFGYFHKTQKRAIKLARIVLFSCGHC